jgi:hypothetical protein
MAEDPSSFLYEVDAGAAGLGRDEVLTFLREQKTKLEERRDYLLGYVARTSQYAKLEDASTAQTLSELERLLTYAYGS